MGSVEPSADPPAATSAEPSTYRPGSPISRNRLHESALGPTRRQWVGFQPPLRLIRPIITSRRQARAAMLDGLPGSGVHIALLGGLAATPGPRGVTAAAWQTRRSAELVAILAPLGGPPAGARSGDRSAVAALVTSSRAANLRKAAHFARRALGSERAVQLAGGRVALFPGSVVDTDAVFERQARAVVRSGDRAAAAALAASYPGDLLPDLLYMEWTQEPRDRLRSLLVTLLRLGEQWERGWLDARGLGWTPARAAQRDPAAAPRALHQPTYATRGPCCAHTPTIIG